MTGETLDWINRCGMTLRFFSIWFVAPEFMGEQRLETWHQIFAKVSSKMPRYFDAFLIAFTVAGVALGGVWGYERGLQDAKHLKTAPTTALGAFAAHRRESDLLLAFAILWPLVILILEKFGPRVLSRLASDSSARLASFFVGACLFTLSFILQFWATF